MAVPNHPRTVRPGSAQSEEGREGAQSYERYLRSAKAELLQRIKSPTNAAKKELAPIESDAPSKAPAGMVQVESLEWTANEKPLSAAKSNACVQTDNGRPERARSAGIVSARFRRASCPGEYVSQLPQRPKTAAGATLERSSQGYAQANGECGYSFNENECHIGPSSPDGLDESEKLARSFMWSTATQSNHSSEPKSISDANKTLNSLRDELPTLAGYSDAGWEDKLPSPLPPVPVAREPTPDPVSTRLNIRRYHSTPEIWQVVTPEWDFVQTRVRSYGAGPPGINFCSPYKQVQQLPGYFGYAPGREDTDFPSNGFSTQLLVRSLQPSTTTISRRANIPGYGGHVHWTKTSPPNPANQLTTARTHRHIPLEEEPSPFKRTSPLSKMVTLVPPHNPFKRIDV